MTLARVALLPLLLVPLAACGSSVVPSASQAGTIACRGYVLTVANEDLDHAKLMIAGSPYGYDPSDPVLAKVRAAAVAAGTTAGLSDADFTLFRRVVERVDGLAARAATSSDGSPTLIGPQIFPIRDAFAAVHRRCY